MAAVLVFGAYVAGHVSVEVLLAALITLPYIIAQEALFNVEDIDEDRLAGLATTATRLGLHRSLRLVRALLIVFIATAMLPLPLDVAAPGYLLAIVVCALTPVMLLLAMLRGDPVPMTAISRAVRLSRLVWVTSFVPLALLG